jgi:hypothetical protein
MPAKQSQTLWDKINRAVRNDPKKAGILTVLVAILVVLQVRLQTNKGESTSMANAAMTGATGSTGTTFYPRPTDSSAALRTWMDAPATALGRNLFAINLERFPQDGQRTEKEAQGTPGFWDDLAKSMSFRADVRKERQILVENLQQQASQIRLQSTMMGATPRAVINGDMVGEGDVVASFRVLKIEPRRIIVEREGIKLEIQMK